MIFLFYNKALLRLLVVVCGTGIGLTTYFYLSLAAAKLGRAGVGDALAIISFFIAGWLVMLVAEVVDNHYARAFAALCVLLGGGTAFRWVFLLDGPKLAELPGGDGGMMWIHIGYWTAMILALALFIILLVRLILDKVNYGRQPAVSAQQPAGPAQEPELADSPLPTAPRTEDTEDLPAIPVDTSPLKPESGAGQVAATPDTARNPVSRLVGIGGVYLDAAFELAPGTHSIGRQDSDILLANDNQVSRNHAVIEVDDEHHATLIDQGSTNGTFVNNQQVQTAELSAGDTIKVGTSIFRAEGLDAS